MVQLIAIIVREITQRHKYRWHVTTEIRCTGNLMRVYSYPYI